VNRYSIIGACLLGWAAAAWSQVSVEVLLDQQQFLPGETIPASVRIVNRSGQTLKLGATEDWLTFSMEEREGTVVPKLGEVPVLGEFELGSGQRGTKHVNLEPYFGLGKSGRYGIRASVQIPGWANEITSPVKYFDLIEGTKLWEQEVGLPRPAGATNAEPEIRIYTLQQANYLKGQIRLYLRVSDPGHGKLLRLQPVGKLLSFSRPDPQVDKLSQLHLLYQSGPQNFSHQVFSTEGELILRQNYEYVDKRPRLRPDEDGWVIVSGGIRRNHPSDFPPDLEPSQQARDLVAPELPPATNAPAKAAGK
jgi:hypothetical protein